LRRGNCRVRGTSLRARFELFSWDPRRTDFLPRVWRPCVGNSWHPTTSIVAPNVLSIFPRTYAGRPAIENDFLGSSPLPSCHLWSLSDIGDTELRIRSKGSRCGLPFYYRCGTFFMATGTGQPRKGKQTTSPSHICAKKARISHGYSLLNFHFCFFAHSMRFVALWDFQNSRPC